MRDSSGARVRGINVYAPADVVRIKATARVVPTVKRRQRLSIAAYAKQAVPEGAKPYATDFTAELRSLFERFIYGAASKRDQFIPVNFNATICGHLHFVGDATFNSVNRLSGLIV